MIIVRGANYYPQNIGRTAERSHPALRPHCNGAFIARRNGREMLVIVQEIERTYRHRINRAEIVGAIRAAIVQEHELTAHDVILIRTSTIPKTTSGGKIRRRLACELWMKGDELWGNGAGAFSRATCQLDSVSAAAPG